MGTMLLQQTFGTIPEVNWMNHKFAADAWNGGIIPVVRHAKHNEWLVSSRGQSSRCDLPIVGTVNKVRFFPTIVGCKAGCWMGIELQLVRVRNLGIRILVYQVIRKVWNLVISRQHISATLTKRYKGWGLLDVLELCRIVRNTDFGEQNLGNGAAPPPPPPHHHHPWLRACKIKIWLEFIKLFQCFL